MSNEKKIIDPKAIEDGMKDNKKSIIEKGKVESADEIQEFNPQHVSKEGLYQLKIPDFLPTNGRIIAMMFGRPIRKTRSGLLLPGSAYGTKGNEREVNPYRLLDYYIVAMCDSVEEQLELPTIRHSVKLDAGKPDKVARSNDNMPRYNTIKRKVGIGDQLFFGAEFIPVIVTDGEGTQYAIVHSMDVIAIKEHPTKFQPLTEEMISAMRKQNETEVLDPKDKPEKVEMKKV